MLSYSDSGFKGIHRFIEQAKYPSSGFLFYVRFRVCCSTIETPFCFVNCLRLLDKVHERLVSGHIQQVVGTRFAMRSTLPRVASLRLSFGYCAQPLAPVHSGLPRSPDNNRSFNIVVKRFRYIIILFFANNLLKTQLKTKILKS